MNRARPPIYVPILFTVLILVVAVILSPARYLSTANGFVRRFSGRPLATVTNPNHLTTENMTSDMNSTKTPIYFLSHGGPNIMYELDHPVYPQLQKIGKEITQVVKPKAIVAFSAHWQGDDDVIKVNTAEITDLIYDFYGFPPHYYKETFPHVGNKEVAENVISLLNGAGIKAKGVTRGLDHGIWAVFKCAFNPEENPLKVPIIQVSLFDNEDPDKHFRLGQAVQALRSQNIQIIVSGMAVHNLRYFQSLMMGDTKPFPWTTSFDDALKDAVTTPPDIRQSAMRELLWRKDARQAHPTFEHLLPIHVGAGAAGNDKAVRLWTLNEGSLGWAQYRFGDVPAKL